MRASQPVIGALIVAFLSTIGISCHDSTAPGRGTIEVTISSSGSDVDPDGYLVSVDSRLTRRVSANTTIIFADIAVGEHSIDVGNLASNCSVSVDNPRRVTVVAEATVTADFPVACVSRTGTVRLTISTTGLGTDANGYNLRVDDGPESAVATNDVLVLTDLREGNHRLSLGDVAGNCLISGGNERTVSVSFANTTSLQFSIACTGAGTLNLTTVTTGLDLDPDGYTVTVAVPTDYYGPYYRFTVPTNGSVSMPDIQAGEYSLSAEGQAPNCKLVSYDPPNLVITDHVVSSASLNFLCYGKGTLNITATTAGVDPDPDGYSVNVQSLLNGANSRAVVPTNGTVTLSNIVGGPYALTVSGWAANCELAGTNPHNILVDDKGPTSVSLNVSCVAARRLAYVATTNGQTNIYTINSNGTGSTRLTTNSASNEDPAWSPDGSTIAFATNRDGAFQIYVMNADGSNQRRLTSSAGSTARQPAWSPDGQKIAFVGTTATGDPEIYVIKADGTGLVRLTQSLGDDVDPAWSPDGSKIAFRSTRFGNAELYVMNADGSNVIRLTASAVDESKPAWSPDGSKIVFAAGGCDFYYGCYSDLFIMKPDGSSTSQLTSNGLSSSPAWSPDGVWIAFVVTSCTDNAPCVDHLALVKSNGAGGGTITEMPASQPAWRP